jgi:hypothetical protein
LLTRAQYKIYIGCPEIGVDAGISEDHIKEAFEKFGRVAKTWVARQPAGFAFVEYEDERDAEDAIKDMDGQELQGHRLKVEMSKSGGRSDVKPGDWACPSCRVNNFARRDQCFRCGARKPFEDGGGGGGGYGGGGGGYGGGGRGGYDRGYDDRGYDR